MVSPVVTTNAGRLRGRDEPGVLVFQGIRYATASRFSSPQPPEPWTGVRDAQAYGPSCPQMVGEDTSYFARTLGPVARAEERLSS
jgi:para-nitrobenzyl esterase